RMFMRNGILRRLGMRVLGFALATLAFAQGAKPLYENNFEKANVGSIPEDFIADGNFAVKQDGANKFLVLPGAPLESFWAMYGPNENENILVTARVFGTSKGRRSPTFGLGIGGQGGYRLQVAPAKKVVE